MTRGNRTNRHFAVRFCYTKRNKGAASISPHGSKSNALVIESFHCGVPKLSDLPARHLYLIGSRLAPREELALSQRIAPTNAAGSDSGLRESGILVRMTSLCMVIGLENPPFLTWDNVLFPRLDSSQTSNPDSVVSSISPSLDGRPRAGIVLNGCNRP